MRQGSRNITAALQRGWDCGYTRRRYGKRRPDFLSSVACHVERLPFHIGLLKVRQS